jgi:7,8-dihydroneopterin aldolase/epimerase/oxygenase
VTDIVSIRGLTVSAVIGVYDWERETTQDLIVNVDLPTDARRTAVTDDLADALDYSAIAASVRTVVTDGKFQLVETAAERIADAVLVGYGVGWVRVEVVKPLAREGYSAAVTVERGIRPSGRF